MTNEFFAGFSPDEKREVNRALEQVEAIRDAYQLTVQIGQQSASAGLTTSPDSLVRKEAGEALAAAGAGSASLMSELVDYSNANAMTPTARAGASRFITMLERARQGDAAALVTVQVAKNELGEANRARADFGVDASGRASERSSTVLPGDRTDLERDLPRETLNIAGTVEVVSSVKSKVNTLALPESFVDRYIRAGDTLVDARAPARLILVDRGRRLDAPAEYSSETVKAMVDIAEARGWSRLAIKGEKEFKAAIYLEGASRGLAVTGYSPSPAEQAVAAHNRNKQFERQQRTAVNPTRSETIAEAFKRAKTPAQREAAATKYPELTNAFAKEAVAIAASRSITPPRSREAYVNRFRDTIAFDLAQGREMADIRLRSPMFREQRERQPALDRGR